MTSRPNPEIIAHRGFSARAPENTLSAMEAALAQLQSQSNALLSLVSNLSLTQSLLAG